MRSRRLYVGAAVVGLAVVALLVLAQLILPGIATQQLRDRLSRHGRVLEVQVHAFPAIELLWHQADRVVVRMADDTSTAPNLQRDVAQVTDVDTLDASAAQFTSGLLKLGDATLLKRGSSITGSGIVTESDLRASLPILDGVTPVSSGDGQLTLQGTGTLLGVTATVDATVRADNGALVVSPDVPFGGLATITLFQNPVIEIQGVAATPAPGGFRVTVTARLR
jgi:hypothetical protein